MTNPRKLTAEELARIAAEPKAALLAFAAGAGTATEIQSLRRKDGSSPKKRRKMSAAWRTMIAITEKGSSITK